MKELEKVLKNQQRGLVKGKRLQDLPAPAEMLNLVPMAQGIIACLDNGQRGCILGDYDADGVSATSVLKTFFNNIGFGSAMDYKIPDRHADGYGLSQNIADYVLEMEYDFVITVDNAISAVEPIKFLKENGVSVFLTDHHTTIKRDGVEILPPADFVVCPKQEKETFPFIEISGATVAWYLTAAIVNEWGLEYDLKTGLDMVAVTVISDVMPVTDINIALLKEGLAQINAKNRRFIWELIVGKDVADETTIGFKIGPLINATGRLYNANALVELFTSRERSDIQKMYTKAHAVNEERKLISREMTEKAFEMIDRNKDIIVVSGDFHEGVVGIIAGRLAEALRRPCIVLAKNGDIFKGSARSFGNINLYDLIKKSEDLLIGFGGHKGAAGMAIAPDQLKAFEDSLQVSAKDIPAKDWESVESKPIEVSLSDINIDMLNLFEKYAPFGLLNPRPRISVNAEIEILRDIRKLHWSVIARDNDTQIKTMFFSVGSNFESYLDDNRRLTFVADINPHINEITGYKDVQIYGRINEVEED